MVAHRNPSSNRKTSHDQERKGQSAARRYSVIHYPPQSVMRGKVSCAGRVQGRIGNNVHSSESEVPGTIPGTPPPTGSQQYRDRGSGRREAKDR